MRHAFSVKGQSVQALVEPSIASALPCESLDARCVDGERRRILRLARLQKLCGALLFFPFGLAVEALLRFWGGFKITNLAEVRRQFGKLARSSSPLVICANHLTYLDSALISHALAPSWWYALHFQKLPWNLPAGDHFKKGIFNRLVAFWFKCIFIHRDGSKGHKAAVLAAVRELAAEGEPVTIFPEGRRSRVGCIDRQNVKYGIGKLLSNLECPVVLCLYLRGDRQQEYSRVPPRRSRFHVGVSVIKPLIPDRREGAYRELTALVVRELSRLENEHFARSHASYPDQEEP
ncbi:MAG TPA: lysophospholipid acyltransferase family protein [Polyangiaceae bacterium]|nr:lysophospholipid acyltransferase family protein [Polyangiaceae bacterium]